MRNRTWAVTLEVKARITVEVDAQDYYDAVDEAEEAAWEIPLKDDRWKTIHCDVDQVDTVE